MAIKLAVGRKTSIFQPKSTVLTSSKICSQLMLNDRARDELKMLYNLKRIEEKLKDLNLPFGQYILVGGSALAARNIRETKDLDIAVLPKLFEHLLEEGWVLDDVYRSKWNRRRVIKEGVEIYPDMYLEKADVFLNVEELISGAEIINGFPFQNLDHLKMCKLDTGREKDLVDVALIEKYLNSASS
jgi:hypothetical protein